MRYKPKRENYANGYYGEIDYNVMLERYCTYLENQNKQLRLHVVMQQRELLYAFVSTMEFDVKHETYEEDIEYFLKENSSI